MKSNLDERQEQLLLRIESRAFWLAYALLLAAIIVQTVLTGFDFRMMAGEWIVFMVSCIYVAGACAKNGIWDRRIKPNWKSNLIVSLIVGAVNGGMMFAAVYRGHPEKPLGSIAAGVFSAGVCFLICFAALSAAARKVRKVQQTLEAEEPDEVEAQSPKK
ncbi:MAG: hypothetical protein K6E30_10250 [Lachnospiraceae bacterium]|nr:hypothetical protein [Lachnospiraceae bacterium]